MNNLNNLYQQAQKLADDIKSTLEEEKSTLQKQIESIGPIKSGLIEFYLAKITIQPDKKSFTIAYPNCNREWTFAVWHWAEEFCKRYPQYYPAHGPLYKDSKYLFIES